ncbi:hypothetical protein AXG93_2960s1270 [Marchantia polymorpha subsp. ruderalis]|uniref:Uncharacterized protein n=1 Tax=Marchantia polymorpha subsp. ruderalis TaxID=1480154 RepID=A0A176W795_MARPO|nr:hypothetical protein AXG93_2960s1270 [Marchantia polymorpha subsp. ruderalis]
MGLGHKVKVFVWRLRVRSSTPLDFYVVMGGRGDGGGNYMRLNERWEQKRKVEGQVLTFLVIKRQPGMDYGVDMSPEAIHYWFVTSLRHPIPSLLENKQNTKESHIQTRRVEVDKTQRLGELTAGAPNHPLVEDIVSSSLLHRHSRVRWRTKVPYLFPPDYS